MFATNTKLLKLVIIFIAVLFFGIQTVALGTENESLDIEYSSMFETEWAYGTVVNNSQKLELIFEPEVNIDFQYNSKFTAIARLRVDVEDNLESGDLSQDATSNYSQRTMIGDHADMEMREFYYETESGETYLKLGKQQIVWGKADGLKVLDVVNPQDFREFILDDFNDSRIPLWTVNAEIPLNDSVLQLIWIPDQTYHAIPKPDSLYAFTSPLLVPVLPAGVAVDLRPVDKPDDFFADADYGMRLSSFIGGWDVTLNYLYHYYDTPVLFQKLALGAQPVVTVTPGYERTHLIGGTFSNAFGEFVLRGELGYSTDRYFLTNNIKNTNGVFKTDEVSYVLGLDWSGISDTFLSMQLFQSLLLDDQPGLVRDKVDTSMTFLASRNFMNDTLVVEILWIHNTNNNDGLVRPKIKYEWQDNINIWLGADTFYGDSKGLFGQFNKNDRIVLGMEWGI